MILKLVLPLYLLTNVLGIWYFKRLLQKRLKHKGWIWAYSVSLSLSLSFMLAFGIVLFMLKRF